MLTCAHNEMENAPNILISTHNIREYAHDSIKISIMRQQRRSIPDGIHHSRSIDYREGAESFELLFIRRFILYHYTCIYQKEKGHILSESTILLFIRHIYA